MLFLFLHKSIGMLRLIKSWLGFSNKTYLNEDDRMKKFLIVGLGNIGSEYSDTRHNIGFKVLDYIAEQENLTFESAKLGALTTMKVKGQRSSSLHGLKNLKQILGPRVQILEF